MQINRKAGVIFDIGFKLLDGVLWANGVDKKFLSSWYKFGKELENSLLLRLLLVRYSGSNLTGTATQPGTCMRMVKLG